MSRIQPPIRICAACGKEIHAARGVCPECGHVTTWFQVRLMLGCAGAAFALLSIGTLIALRILGIA